MAVRLKTIAPIVLTGIAQRIFPSGALPNIQSLYVAADDGNAGVMYVGDADVDMGRGIKIDVKAAVSINSDGGRGGGAALLSVEGLFIIGTPGEIANISYLEVC
jgi:hypothetical protein